MTMIAPRGLDTREKIDRTALRLFVEQGIAETSIRDIATAAGVSLGAMYNHYVSKEALTLSLFSTNMAAAGRELRHIAREHHALQDKLPAMIRYVFEEFDRDWLKVTFVFMARHQHLRQFRTALGNPYILFRTVIADAIRRGEIPRQDPELAAALVAGAFTTVFDAKILGRLKGDLATFARPTAAACLRMLRA